MRPPLDGDYPITAGWRYSSGDGHFATDYGTPIGVRLYAIAAGVILDCNDGVPNDRPGSPDYTGEPSNWVLLGVNWNGQHVSIYYQHMSPGLKVRRGQRVSQGQLLGFTGDSGNTTAPHFHCAAMFGYQNAATRYIYMNNDGDNPYVIYPPSKVWGTGTGDDVALDKDDKDFIREAIRKEVWQHDVAITSEGNKKQSFHAAVTRWNTNRSVPRIAEASATATVRALKRAGLVQMSDKELNALVKDVAQEVATEFAEQVVADLAP